MNGFCLLKDERAVNVKDSCAEIVCSLELDCTELVQFVWATAATGRVRSRAVALLSLSSSEKNTWKVSEFFPVAFL